ncbi:MAG: LTA synthase family protein [Clostridia bacterium]|nr:LTA synthase family protein [Clostridia bacterium]
MVWFGAIAIGLVIGFIDIVLLADNKKVGTVITVLVRDTLLSVLSGMVLADKILGVKNIFDISSMRISYTWKFLGLVVAVGVVFIILSGFIKRVFKFEFCEIKKKKGAFALKIVSAVLFALGVAAYTGTLWGKEAFGDLAPDQILINLNSPTEGTDVGVYISLFTGPVLMTVLLTVIFCTVVFPKYRLAYEKGDDRAVFLPEIAIRIISFILALAIFVGGCAFGIERFQLTTLFDAYLDASTYIEDNFADPETVKLTFPEEKRNLIFIYLESMENTFFSKDLGGYWEENYMPDLAELSKEGISFSHREEGLFGGAFKTSGSGWSVAAMVNMNTGLPMKVPVDGNSYGQPGNFLPGATCLGDILKEQGYEQSVMFGADAAFGGLDFFFQSHGDFNIFDHKGVIEKGWLPEYYDVWWGYEDDKLYEFAKRELTRLGDTGKPFHFVMETADTHAPDGYLSENAEKKYDSQYANCIYYSQSEAVKFVRWIQEQDFYDNTTVIIVGDHLSMANAFFEDVQGYRRTIYNLFLNVPENLQNIPKEYTYNRKWAPFDMFPTTLACMGVEIEGERLGIGTNMFSGEKTLVETDGLDKVNEELANRSNFYNNNILVDWEAVGKEQ